MPERVDFSGVSAADRADMRESTSSPLVKMRRRQSGVWHRFRRHRLALLGSLVLLLLVIASLAAPLIARHDPYTVDLRAYRQGPSTQHILGTDSSGRMAIAVPEQSGLILLIEDEPQVQAVTARILRAFGYGVITAHNERSALAQAEQHGPSIGLVVSDLVLPGVSGKDLVRRLRQPCEHAQVLYISGYSPEHVGALTDGARFLRKPFTAQELLALVRELLPQLVAAHQS